ncbi:MAG TPA: peptidylprolyl isomerase [Geobacteraceae bacterium]|nr:peptidylprolyl isomerase [Geobacteraceae bacterium]
MHTKNIFTATTIALCLALLVGCQSKSAQEGNKSRKEGQTVAEVNGSVITTADFKKEVETLPPYLRPMAETPEGKTELLDTMIIREIIIQQAQKDGLDKSPAVTDKLEELKKRLIVEAFLKKKIEDQANITDADLQKFYDQNKDKFNTGDQVRASHILVKSEKEAQDILGQIKKGGNFEALAKKYSVDSAGAKGGDLGWFGKGSMIPEFEKVVFSLKEGELSGVVKTQFGYHIIKLTGKRPAGIRSFAEAKEQIKAKLLPEKQQQTFQKLKDELKKSAKYSIKEDVLKGIDIKPATAAQAAPGEAKEK